MITPAIRLAFEQQWQQMRAEAQRLARGEEVHQRARAASLRLLVEHSQTERLEATSADDLIGRCLLLTSGLRGNSERSISALEGQPRAQERRWQERLGRMQGALSALQEYEAFLLRMRKQERDQDR